MEERVHHELFHFIEAVVNKNMFYKDPNWLKLNPPSFKYDTNPIKAYLSPNFQNVGHPQAGFVSAYSLDSIYEDKAEVFAWMMTWGYSERLEYWAKYDPVLKIKKEYILKSFKVDLETTMNEEFFTKFSISNTTSTSIEVAPLIGDSKKEETVTEEETDQESPPNADPK